MKAYLKRAFPKGFFLSEESIIKLNDIISKRIEEKAFPGQLGFKVYRSDSLVYETTDHQKTLQEENSKRNLITRLEFGFKTEDLKFELSFDKSEKANLEIESADKDFAYLLFSDIKEYLNTEVLRFRSFEFKSTRIERVLLPLLFPVFFVFLVFGTSSKSRLSESEFQDLLNSESLIKKLNYLAQESRNRTEFLGRDWMLLAIAILLIVAVFTLPEVLDKIYPINIFYLGKEVARYDSLRSLRGRFVWGIVVAFIVSALASIFVFMFTRH